MTFAEAQQQGYVITTREYTALTDTILNQYKDAFKEIQKEIKESYARILAGIPPEEYFNEMTKYKRLQGLNDAISKNFNKAALAAGRTQAQASALAMSNNYYRQMYTIDWSEEANGVFVTLNPKVVELSVFGTEAKWAEISAANKAKWKAIVPQAGTLSSTLASNRVADLKRIRASITRAMINGDSFTKLSRDLQKDFETTANNAIRIARTEGIRNLNSGNLAAVENLREKGVDVVRIWDATLDNRVRPTHAAADGQPEDENGMFHVGDAVGPGPGNMSTAGESINCRCTTYNQVAGTKRGMRRGRDPETGKTDLISYRTFDTWATDNELAYNRSGRLVPKK